jgi:ATP-dependent Clp protease ATP-binding subunit ClpC
MDREEPHLGAPLDSLGRLLTSKEEQEKLLPVCGRDALVREFACHLELRNNVILVGEPGCGKTAIVEKLAAWIRSGHPDLPERLGGRHILECDHSAFQYECHYVHEFETRFRTIVRKCQAKGVILFFENIHLVGGAGAVEGNEDRTVATMLTPYLSRGEITVIGASTAEGFQALLRRNPSFAAKFIKRDVAGMSAGETRESLCALRSHIQARHGVEIVDAALEEIIRVADRFYPWKVFPGKAFDILKETLARKSHLGGGGELQSAWLFPATLSVGDVLETIARRTGLGPHIVRGDLPVRREEIVRCFQDAVFGQEEAITCLADAILSFKAELNDPERPIGVFLFCGPSGVGKTELGRQLARYLFGSERRLLRYDMSEFADFDSMRRFLGGNPRPNGKSLVDNVAATPFSVVLLDEIEKANPVIFNLLLQAFGEGRLTDWNGNTAYLSNCIFIMTSNLASDLYGREANRIGLVGGERRRDGAKPTQKELSDRVKASFAPEFVNRITKIVHFNPLSHETIRKVARKEIDRVLQRHGIRRRGLRVSIRPALERILIEKGFDAEYGARPMQRAVEELVVSPLAVSVACADIADQQEIVLDWTGAGTEIHKF